ARPPALRFWTRMLKQERRSKRLIARCMCARHSGGKREVRQPSRVNGAREPAPDRLGFAIGLASRQARLRAGLASRDRLATARNIRCSKPAEIARHLSERSEQPGLLEFADHRVAGAAESDRADMAGGS